MQPRLQNLWRDWLVNHPMRLGIGSVAAVVVLAAAVMGVGHVSRLYQLDVSIAAQARAAAARAVPGGRPGHITHETGEDSAAYGVTVTQSDGKSLEVRLDRNFHVLSAQAPDPTDDH
jgi:hypothetical protein